MSEESRPIEDARLKSLRIEGFKCFADSMIPLANLTMLAGGNSVGKSSVIQALLLMRSAYGMYDPRRYLGSPIRDEKTIYSAPIPLNDNFLMQLGTSRDVVTNEAIQEIRFSIENRQNQFGVLHFEVPLEVENYLTFTGMDADPDPHPLHLDIRHNPLFMPPDPRAFYYLNAERIGPRPFYDMSGEHIFDTGWQGEYTIQVLSSYLYDRFKIEPKMSFENGENLSFGIQINNWMNYIIPGTNLNARKLNEINKSVARINNHSPHNVGFGISYVLPIVVSGLLALPNSMFIVENPEAHLHPSGQSRIGQFLAQVASAGVQVVVETHSEHVLNGIRIATMKGVLMPDDLAINFFQRNEDTENIEIQQIGLTGSGDLTKFPTGFFDQTQQDLVELIKLKQAQPR